MRGFRYVFIVPSPSSSAPPHTGCAEAYIKRHTASVRWNKRTRRGGWAHEICFRKREHHCSLQYPRAGCAPSGLCITATAVTSGKCAENWGYDTGMRFVRTKVVGVVDRVWIKRKGRAIGLLCFVEGRALLHCIPNLGSYHGRRRGRRNLHRRTWFGCVPVSQEIQAAVN